MSVQVIDLVTEGTRQKIVRGDLVFLTLAVGSAHGHVLGALNKTVATGYGKAALRTLLLAAVRDDLGVDVTKLAEKLESFKII